MNDLTLLIKPAGPDCNLRCDYCFYLEKASLFPGAGPRRMSDEVLSDLLRNYFAIRQPVYSFCWQGGEPTLMGLPFYERVTSLQGSLAPPGAVIVNSVQTNGTRVTAELARHFADYRFLVGCSLDGPPEIHDRHRRGPDGQPSHAAVLSAIDLLGRHGVPVNVLALVSRANVGRAAELYGYFRGLGLSHLQFIPCVLDRSGAGARGAAISGREWGEFLCELFEAWWPGDVGAVSIRLFDAVAQKLAGGGETICTLAGDCRQYLVVEHDGGVYPCDFHVDSGHRLGDVRADSLDEIRRASAYREFGARKHDLVPECLDCPQLDLCRGGCPANRPPGEASRLCEGWRLFFDHARPRFEQLAGMARAARAGGGSPVA